MGSKRGKTNNELNGIDSKRGKTNNELNGIDREGQEKSYILSGKSIYRYIFIIILPWVLVIANVFLLFQLRRQVNSLNDSLGLMLKRILILEEQQNMESQEEVQSGMHQSDLSVPVMSDNVVSENVVSGNRISDYGLEWGMEKVEKPKDRTHREVLERLKLLGTDNELIKQVADNNRDYPKRLLEALANNPELQDFAANYLKKKGTVEGGLTDSEKNTDFPLFLQWDPRWGYASYGDDSVVGLAGCGPTALSMVLYYLTGDETLTPDKLAEYSMKNGYYISGTGTAWLLLENIPPRYGISVAQPDASQSVMEQALDNGQVIICSMGPGDFTIGGHFIVVYGYDEEGFLVNDPNCVARSREHWTWEQLKNQIKHIWIFGKGDSSQGNLYDNWEINIWTEPSV